MSTPQTDRYLRELDKELRRRGIADGDLSDLIEEIRGHLDDAVAAAERRGLSTDAAQHHALARVGAAADVAEQAAADRFRMRHRLLFGVAIVLGLAITWVDSSPGWDDTGVTAGTLVMCGAILGFAGPHQPWRWAIALGLWIPLNAIVRAPSLSTFGMLIIIAFPMAGAYVGAFIRRTNTRLPKWISTT